MIFPLVGYSASLGSGAASLLVRADDGADSPTTKHPHAGAGHHSTSDGDDRQDHAVVVASRDCSSDQRTADSASHDCPANDKRPPRDRPTLTRRRYSRRRDRQLCRTGSTYSSLHSLDLLRSQRERNNEHCERPNDAMTD
jgi:hypothetical protein